MLPGAILAMLGFGSLMAVMFSSGGVAKSRQFSVLGQLASGQHGSGKRVWLLVSIACALLGTCGAFAGVAVGDAQRREACERTCEQRGYAQGKIQGSKERVNGSKGKHAFVACACTQGPEPDPLELRADDLLPDAPSPTSAP